MTLEELKTRIIGSSSLIQKVREILFDGDAATIDSF